MGGLTLLSDLIDFLILSRQTPTEGPSQSRQQLVIIVLLIAPIWLIALCLVAGLCMAARVGDQQRCLMREESELDVRGEETIQAHPASPAARGAAQRVAA